MLRVWLRLRRPEYSSAAERLTEIIRCGLRQHAAAVEMPAG
jgi:hypothetical protein